MMRRSSLRSPRSACASAGRRRQAVIVGLTLLGVSLAVGTGPSVARWVTGRPRLEAGAAILLDADSGQVLYGRDEASAVYPASTAKMLTALVALESLPSNQALTLGPEIRLAPHDASKAGLAIGERLTVEELVWALMLPSGGDAAYALAVHAGRARQPSRVSGPRQAVSRFVALMNERAARAGARHSRFVNPDGAHDDRQVTTAADLALIAREAIAHPLLRQIVGTARHVRSGRPRFARGLQQTTTGAGGVGWDNRNRLLDPAGPYYYAGTTGIKTGRTEEAGHCLVSSAERGGRTLIAVVMRSTASGVWTDSMALLDHGFAQLDRASPPSFLPTR